MIIVSQLSYNIILFQIKAFFFSFTIHFWLTSVILCFTLDSVTYTLLNGNTILHSLQIVIDNTYVHYNAVHCSYILIL